MLAAGARKKSPPQRSQYFNSTCSPAIALSLLKFMIASPYGISAQRIKKPWRRSLGPGLVSLTMTCLGYLIMGKNQLLRLPAALWHTLPEVSLFIPRFE